MVGRRDIVKNIIGLIISSTYLGRLMSDSAISEGDGYYIQWEGTLSLATKTSWEKICLDLESKVDVVGLENIKQGFINSGGLVRMETVFSGHQLQWKYIFRSKNDLEAWMQKTAGSDIKNKFDNSTFNMTVQLIRPSEVDYLSSTFKNLS